MAVYRSDQAQLTFATEAGKGGYLELATTVTADGSKVGRLTADTPAGTRTLAVDNMVSNPVIAGDYIQIGPGVGGDGVTTHETEIRRAEYVDGTTAITLDAPTAFFHADNTDLKSVTAVTDADGDKLISWVPGVYETVEVPDPEMAIEGRYLLGIGQKRNFFKAYKGQQTFAGSLGGIVLLNGWPLRYPVGKVASIPVLTADTSDIPVERTFLSASAKKGDMYITVNSVVGLAAGDLITLDYRPAANVTDNDRCEIRRIISVSGSSPYPIKLNYPLHFDHPAGTDEQMALLNEALDNSERPIDVDNLRDGTSDVTNKTTFNVGDFISIDGEIMEVDGLTSAGVINVATRASILGGDAAEVHSDDAVIYRRTPIHEFTTDSNTYYQHNIWETVDLDSMAWHVHMRDSDEAANKDFDRRYYGGKVGSMSIAADEGGLLTASWDGVTFFDMIHNQKINFDTVDTSEGYHTTQALPGYELMQSITSDNIGVPFGASATAAGGFPTSDPYYFSQGSLKMFGVEFARVRSFNISISNGEEPRYYIGGQGKGTRRHRGPTEIREQQREYSMSVSLALPDSVIGDGVPSGTIDKARRIFTELLLEGDYGTLGATASMQGFNIELTFTRGTNDSIQILIPKSYTSGDESSGTGANDDEHGAFIRSASHSITGDNPLQVDADILFRSIKIVIKDAEPFYP